jgi:hypothetical protein
LLVVPLAYGVVIGTQERLAARRKRRQARKAAAQLEKATPQLQKGVAIPAEREARREEEAVNPAG